MTIRNGAYTFKESDPWIGFDLDATLAFYDKWEHSMKIGEMIEGTKQLVLAHLASNQRVKIFTARMFHHDEADAIREAVQDWLEANGLPRLEVTNIKDFKMLSLYDDRAIQMVPNKGISLESVFSAQLEKYETLQAEYKALKEEYDELKFRMDGLDK